MRYAVVNQDGEVINAIEADENFKYGDPLCCLIPSNYAAPGWRYDPKANEFIPPSGTIAGVIAERERRLSLGFEYKFADERGSHHIGTSRQDMEGWTEVTNISNAAIAMNEPNKEIYIATNSGQCIVTAIEWQSILISISEFRQPIWAASFALQEMSPIPHNFRDDKYWQ